MYNELERTPLSRIEQVIASIEYDFEALTAELATDETLPSDEYDEMLLDIEQLAANLSYALNYMVQKIEDAKPPKQHKAPSTPLDEKRKKELSERLMALFS